MWLIIAIWLRQFHFNPIKRFLKSYLIVYFLICKQKYDQAWDIIQAYIQKYPHIKDAYIELSIYLN